MNRRARIPFAAAWLALACVLAPHATLARGQGQSTQQTTAVGGASASNSSTQQTTTDKEGLVSSDNEGRVTTLFARGGRVAVDNRTAGPIRVVGWDRDTVEAVARSERGAEAVRVRIDESPAGRRVSFYADYADYEEHFPTYGDTTLLLSGRLSVSDAINTKLRSRDPLKSGTAPAAKSTSEEKKSTTEAKRPSVQEPSSLPVEPARPAKETPAAPSQKVVPPAEARLSKSFAIVTRPRLIDIEVRVPRYAEVEMIRVIRSPVEVTDVDTPVRVLGDQSEIRLTRVGAAEVRTTRGHVFVRGARGTVDVTTFDGPIDVSDSEGDVRARSIAGAVTVTCARGRVDATSADGAVTIVGGAGDVDANTTASDLTLTATPRAGARYNLKSMAGRVEFFVEEGTGFNASLSSYRGAITSDFPLEAGEDTTQAATNRRRTGRVGDGRAHLTLDSFEGPVRLSRAAPGRARACRQ